MNINSESEGRHHHISDQVLLEKLVRIDPNVVIRGFCIKFRVGTWVDGDSRLMPCQRYLKIPKS